MNTARVQKRPLLGLVLLGSSTLIVSALSQVADLPLSFYLLCAAGGQPSTEA